MANYNALTKKFSGVTFHYWPVSFNRKSDAVKFAESLRAKGYKVRLVKNELKQYQPFTSPKIRSSDW